MVASSTTVDASRKSRTRASAASKTKAPIAPREDAPRLDGVPAVAVAARDATDGDAAELEPPVAVVEQQDDLAVVERRRGGGKAPAIALAPCADGDDRRLAVVDEGHGGAPRIGDDIGDVGRRDVARRPRGIPHAASIARRRTGIPPFAAPRAVSFDERAAP